MYTVTCHTTSHKRTACAPYGVVCVISMHLSAFSPDAVNGKEVDMSSNYSLAGLNMKYKTNVLRHPSLMSLDFVLQRVLVVLHRFPTVLWLLYLFSSPVIIHI